MPKIYYCLKCSTAKYSHSRRCRSIETKVVTFSDGSIHIYKAHELVDLHRKPYCSWERDYSRLRRVYARRYNPDGWYPVGWYCKHCGNFIKTN